MNDATAIRARKLRKIYRIYHRPVDALLESLGGRRRHLERIALDGIDLDLRRGEIVGILGRNGAGKSTLLKVISGTLDRSGGQLSVHGRITAMLELGTGFHPEYTGRENIYMGGLCLGMSRGEIERKVDSIIDFSELRDFIDQPFKTYSTGMQARLAFSTAISVDPDILIVDEALSVGDARFQMKCYSWMQKLRERDCTILLVSHDTNTITSFCDRAVILEKGRVYAEGSPKELSVLYHHLLFGTRDMKAQQEKPQSDRLNGRPEEVPEPDPPHRETFRKPHRPAKPEPLIHHIAHPSEVRYGSSEARLVDWGLADEFGNRCTVIASGSAFRLDMVLLCEKEIDDLSCGFAIKDRRGTVLWGVTNISQNLPPYRARAGETLSISAEGAMWLAAGDYFVTMGAAHLEDGNKIDFLEDAIEFKVSGPSGIFTTSTVNLQTVFQISSSILARGEKPS